MNFFTKTKFLIAVIIVLSATIIAIFGTMGYHYFRFERESNDRPRENKQMAKYVAKQLQLSPEQVIQFDSLREKFHGESVALTRDSRKVSIEIMEEIMSEKPDISKLKLLAEKFGKMQENQKQLMIDHLLEVRSKCNPSQQVHFRKLIRQMENHEQRERNRNAEGRRR
jgi:hypothetical protein